MNDKITFLICTEAEMKFDFNQPQAHNFQNNLCPGFYENGVIITHCKTKNGTVK